MSRILGGILILVGLAGAAFWLLSGPDIPRATLEAKYAKPPSQFMRLADGARAHIRDRGPRNAPVLVLIHGSNASLFTWEPWVKRLDNTYRVVTLDLPGHGLTGAVPNGDYSQEGMVAFIKEVADGLGLKQFAIGGNSMGGAIAARFTEKYPERISRLILIDSGGLPTNEGQHIPLAFRLARTPFVNKVLLHITPRSLVVEGLNDAIVRKKIITNRMIDLYWDFARMTGTRQATLIRFQLPWNTAVKDHIADIKAPTLILWGEEDHLVPVEAARQFAANIHGARLVVYPHTGHIPQEEVPQKSADDLRAFLSGKEPSMSAALPTPVN
ncbi:MAG TPA: alpha/beta hydrolase [Rhizomicrobium sp.]|jgi:pimeloyl-ACP methyl ester carboxylesterase